ncbi:hypothetical protein ACOL3L_07355 [Aliarcobacter butzleri]|uniref:hypothetical protein n=1 Tax=Aliarcobacter butzleri TaxID=28197 RepID=UPI00263F38C0|nr:hypothetical protein [Aliarcobacter butzleri]MDN5080229.1 hypothetical protein [Aliarcobacter butzleri]
MKIALIDNMNNNFFSFARYLRDLYIDADVYTISTVSKHFDINADTFKKESQLTYVKEFPCSVKNKSWLFFDKNKILNQFKHYELIISCGVSSAYLERAGVFSDIIIPYGSDLYDIPFRNYRFKISLDFIRSIFWRQQAKYQIKAYNKTRVLVSDDGYELYAEALEKLKLKCLNIGIPMLYNFEDIDNSENQKIWSFLEQHDFIIFNHSRQHWKSYNIGLEDFNHFGGLKRNDKLVKAFSLFLKYNFYKNPLLVLFEYGPDVYQTKELIIELNIQDYVKWMPTMQRKNIMYGLSKATLSTNAFRENKTDIGGVCYESFAVGVPHLNNCIDAIENPKHKFYQAPMIHALSEYDILNIFLDYQENTQKYKKIGQKSKEWFDEHLGLGLAKKYVTLLEMLIEDKFLTQDNKKVKNIFES